MRDAAIVEKGGKPVMLAVTEEFARLGETMARTVGHANMRRLVFPYPLEGLPAPEVSRIARELYPRFLEGVGIQR